MKTYENMTSAVLSVAEPNDEQGDEWEDAPTNPRIPRPDVEAFRNARTCPEIPSLRVGNLLTSEPTARKVGNRTIILG